LGELATLDLHEQAVRRVALGVARRDHFADNGRKVGVLPTPTDFETRHTQIIRVFVVTEILLVLLVSGALHGQHVARTRHKLKFIKINSNLEINIPIRFLNCVSCRLATIVEQITCKYLTKLS
jgi:hypothetical protein